MIGRIGGAPIGSAAPEMTHRKAIYKWKEFKFNDNGVWKTQNWSLSSLCFKGSFKIVCGDDSVYDFYLHLVNKENEHIFVNILLKF